MVTYNKQDLKYINCIISKPSYSFLNSKKEIKLIIATYIQFYQVGKQSLKSIFYILVI